MSGRGNRRNNRGGRGGRNNGGKKNYKSKKTNNSKSNDQKELKFHPHSGTRGNYATYATIKEAIIKHIQTNYESGKDIAKSLKDMKLVDLDALMPVREITPERDDQGNDIPAEKRKERQEGIDMVYNARVIRFLDRQENLSDNLIKAYGLIFSKYCTKLMQARIEEHPDFATKIDENPIALLEAIKVLMHDPVRATYHFASISETITRHFNLRQQENESLIDWTKRFKQSADVLKSTLGTTFLDDAMENTAAYCDATDDEQQEVKDNALEGLNAYLLIKNSDQLKYGSLMRTFVQQYSLGTDQYPKTMTTATDALSTHKLDEKYYENKQKQCERARTETQDERPVHSTSFAQRSTRKNDLWCYCCGEHGHGSNTCNKKDDIPYKQWAVNQAIQAFQDELDPDHADNNNNQDDDDNRSVQSTRSTTSHPHRRSESRTENNNRSRSQSTGRRGVNVFQVMAKKAFCGFSATVRKAHTYVTGKSEESDDTGLVTKQGKKPYDHLHDKLLMDSGSTIPATIKNPDMLTNIRVSKEPLIMHTNAGTATLRLEGDLLGTGTVGYYEPNQTANVIGLSAAVDAADRVTFDSAKEDAFHVYKDGKVTKFPRTPEGLYAYKPTKKEFEQVAESKRMKPPDSTPETGLVNTIETVKENMKGFTKRQIEQAKRARKLMTVLGFPTTENFKHILRQRLVRNCPVTTEDINIAEKIWGSEIASMKGKKTRSRPALVRNDIVEIPPEIMENHSNLTLYMDIMYVNGMPMLTSVDAPIRFRSLVPLNSRKAEEIYRALDVILRAYNHAEFTIREIQCDNEFKTLMNEIKDDIGIHMNIPPADEKVGAAERNNRTIGERVRATYHHMPYKAIPRIMLKYLAMVSTQQLNLFPAKGGVSPYYSPHVILKKRDIDYEKHCQVPFGTYVQAKEENHPTNTNAPRTIDAIYLRPIPNHQGGHEVMNLETGRPVTTAKVWEKPVTQFVINAVEAMAAEQKIKTLKLQGRNKQPLFPADWIAGVDYEGDIQNDDDDEDYAPEDDDDDIPDLELRQNYDSDDDSDDEFDPIDQDEIDELFADNNEQENDTANDEPEEDEEANPANIEPEQPGEPEVNPVSDEGTVESESDERPRRTITKPDRLTYSQVTKRKLVFADDVIEKLEKKHNIKSQMTPENERYMEYESGMALVIAQLMLEINMKTCEQGANFAQQFILQKGLKKFGDRGKAASHKELDQLHQRNCFQPVSISELTPEEKRKAQEALLFLTEKRDKSIKGRLVYNGKPSREWLSKEDSASPTVSLESIFLLAVIDAKERRDVMSADIPNAFIQTSMPPVEEGQERVIMKITGVLVDLLVEMAPDIYAKHVVYENGRKVLYVQVLKALYGMLIAALLWYKQFRKDLESVGFKFNPYDPCVANRKVFGKQHTVRFHVDDLMSSHERAKVNDNFLHWLNKQYGSYGAVKATRGPIHDYLGMTFDFSEPGKVKVDMIDYMKNMVDEFPVELGPNTTSPTPAPDDLFATGNGELLDKKRAEEFHTFVAKALFACKRARPDIHTATTLLCTRVKAPNQDDWRKLVRMMKFINGTIEDKLILAADDLHVIKWYVDSSFAVHPDFRSHTGIAMSYGTGTPITKSQKQKLNTRSSTEAELVGADDASGSILWTKYFVEAQGYKVKKNILNQDNKSTILLLENGKKSSSKRTRAINIRYFFLTDQIEKGNLNVEHCPTTEMIGDFFTKPLQGKLFTKLRNQIMGY